MWDWRLGFSCYKSLADDAKTSKAANANKVVDFMKIKLYVTRMLYTIYSLFYHYSPFCIFLLCLDFFII